MSDYCVIVADAARARFFTLQSAELPELESGPNLVEQKSLDNAEATMTGREKYSDAKSGRNAGGAGAAHGYDDHRTRHDEEYTRRFAQKVAEQAVTLAASNGAYQIVIAAEKQMLGFLRGALGSSNGKQITEVGKDLTKFSPTDIHQYLAGEGVLPARRGPMLKSY